VIKLSTYSQQASIIDGSGRLLHILVGLVGCLVAAP